MRTGLIVCGALGYEVQAIVQKHGWDARIIGVSPTDHMYPLRIAPDVERRILKLRSDCDQLAVVFGECGSQGTLDQMLERYDLHRIDAQNCYEMYAGDTYHQLLEEELGTFFLTDFLVRTFHRTVIRGLGLDRYPELKDSYFHNCKRIVYLVQSVSEELSEQAQEIADYMELPLQIHYTGLDGLEERIRNLTNREEYRNGLPSCKTTCCWKNNIGNELSMRC
ncbi:MAG: DUF1638 domain-containing protein [Chloroflexi bacterium]|jgi:hypothetical protein|nr:DUF1638 domain-containing protein [Chloroflexota bacterium]